MVCSTCQDDAIARKKCVRLLATGSLVSGYFLNVKVVSGSLSSITQTSHLLNFYLGDVSVLLCKHIGKRL